MSNETKQEHTERELWKVVLTPNGYSVFNSIGKEIASQVSKVEAERIVACVNAMKGIEDPEDWVDAQKQINRWNHEKIEELQKYKTACESINPDNPIAVAENIWNAVECVKVMAEGTIDEIRKYREQAHKTLTKIQSK